MAKTRKQKEEIQGELDQKIKDAESVVFVGFNALKVSDSIMMRRALKEEGTGYLVVKKSLLKRSLDQNKVEGSMPELSGEVAVAYGDDAVLPAKAISTLKAKLEEGKLSFLGGVLSGKFLSAPEMIALSKIPSREVLYGKFVSVLNGPIQGFVGTLNAVPQSFVRTLDQIAKVR